MQSSSCCSQTTVLLSIYPKRKFCSSSYVLSSVTYFLHFTAYWVDLFELTVHDEPCRIGVACPLGIRASSEHRGAESEQGLSKVARLANQAWTCAQFCFAADFHHHFAVHRNPRRCHHLREWRSQPQRSNHPRTESPVSQT